MKRKQLLFVSVLAGILLVSSPGFSEVKYRDGKNRLALVIGNAGYEEARLKNSVNDARDMTRTLKSIGFEVIHREDAGRREMEEAVREFGKRLVRKGGTGLFYFAGHGMQVRGRNYLIPIGAKIETESDIGYEAVDAGRAVGKMNDAGNELNIIILDACRSNRFGNLGRGGVPRGVPRGIPRAADAQGLAKMTAPTGSIIAYATAPGSVAMDGDGRNGVYTKYLVKNMRIPGLTIEEVLKKTRIDVAGETKNRQIPWEHSSLMGTFHFTDTGARRDGRKSPSALGALKVECDVSGARVMVDGNYAGKTDLQNTKISPGEHMIRVEKEGYKSYERRINIRTDRDLSLIVALAPAPKDSLKNGIFAMFAQNDPAPKKSAKARIYVNPHPSDANIQILNIRTPFHQGIEVEAGEYHLEISAGGYETEKKWIIAAAGEERKLTARLKSVVAARAVERAEGERMPEAVVAAVAGETTDPGTGHAKPPQGKTNSIGMKFVLLPPGTFMMGSPPSESGRAENETQHRVTLTKGFYIQTTEVTQEQWEAVTGYNSSHFKNHGNNHPVEKVSWNDVRGFIENLNEMEGTDNYRLPTEAEWEYAARAGTSSAFSWGDRTDCDKMLYENDVDSPEDKCADHVRQRGLPSDSTAPVMSFAPNSLGIYDMHGNVYEWCQDTYGNMEGGSQTDPLHTAGSHRVVRSGGWNRGALRCRSADRTKARPDSRSYNIGFRLVMTNQEGSELLPP